MLDANLRDGPNIGTGAPSSPAAATSATKSPASARLTAVARRLAAEPIAPAISPIVLAGFVRLVEFTAIALLGTAIYLVYVVPNDGFAAYYPVAILTLSAAAVLAFQAVDIYHVQAFRSVASQFSRLSAAWTIVFLVAFAVAFFARLEDAFSRVWIATWYASGMMMLLALRIGLASLVRTWTQEGRLVRRTAIVGGGEAGENLIKSLEAQPDCDLAIVGVFDDRSDRRSPDRVGDKLKLGSVADLVEFARRSRIDLVVFSLPVSAESRILAMLKKLWVLPVDIRLSAHSAQLRFRPRAYSYIGNVPTLDVFDRPLADWDVVMKWLFDKIVGSLALLALSPVMLVVAIAVKLDSPGPVLFRQKRYGFNNELIEVYKFRSMYTDTCDATASRLVTKGDSRVTRVGRFIRKTSLDELPQLFNVVFAGNLSLVGPRPHAMHAKAEDRLYDEAVDGYFARHRVKPGITGWAQINGWRGETDTEEKIQRRVEHDLYYIENWSIMFDLAILLKTPFALLKSENAY
ncbi:MAG: undecaprenyl-phosphate glucose phosphotransferase [Methylacidiphilales bacterium]|nr:undecaprenyl-phosphate glucose phosphotransferase [Candidatus Methylacidiphilales bacterium]